MAPMPLGALRGSCDRELCTFPIRVNERGAEESASLVWEAACGRRVIKLGPRQTEE